MKRHIDALNELDENSLAETLLSSLSSSRLKAHVWTEKKSPCRFSQKGWQ